MEATPRRFTKYTTRDGRVPFDDWFHGLRDSFGKGRIIKRLQKVEAGTLGDTDNAGEGVQGLKIHVGPGYRVYFGQDGPLIVILLCGGEKHGQDRDMATAREYWRDYKSRKKSGELE